MDQNWKKVYRMGVIEYGESGGDIGLNIRLWFMVQMVHSRCHVYGPKLKLLQFDQKCVVWGNRVRRIQWWYRFEDSTMVRGSNGSFEVPCISAKIETTTIWPKVRRMGVIEYGESIGNIGLNIRLWFVVQMVHSRCHVYRPKIETTTIWPTVCRMG
jgi:hypothetical protein